MVDRGLVVLTQGFGMFKPELPSPDNPDNKWETIPYGPLAGGSAAMDKVVLARNLDIQSSRYWITAYSQDKSQYTTMLFYAEAGFSQGISYHFPAWDYPTPWAGVARGQNVVFLCGSPVNRMGYFVVNKEQRDNETGKTKRYMVASGGIYTAFVPHSLALLDDLRDDAHTACYVTAGATPTLHCLSFATSSKVWDTQENVTSLSFPDTSDLDSLQDAWVTIQPRRIGGYLLYIASNWKTRDNLERLRITIMGADNDLTGTVPLYDNYSTGIGTKLDLQRLTIEDAYYDRLAKTFMATGVIKLQSTKTFFVQMRHLDTQ